MLFNPDLEISLLPGDILYFGKGQKFYIYVPADLDQFGRDNSHGAVIGGKGLVKLRHHSAD